MPKYRAYLMRAGISVLIFINMLSAAHADVCAASCRTATVEGQKVKNPINCYQYYICSDVDGDKVFEVSEEPLDCAEGTYFSEGKGCITIPTTGAYCTDLCNPCSIECSEAGTLLPDPYECTNYYVCLDGTSDNFIHTSCESGYSFDYKELVCLKAEDATCYKFCNPCDTYCFKEGRIPNPYDCHSYYYCVPPDQLAIFHCDQGFSFDTESGLCANGTCTNLCEDDSTTSDGSVSDTSTESPLTTTTTTTTTTAVPP